MARKLHTQDSSSDDDAPETVSHTASKADAKRNQKVLRDFEAGEKARKKARNRERDQKLKERARATKGGKTKTGKNLSQVRFLDEVLEGEDVNGSGKDVDDIEARMLRAMSDAADEIESDVDEEFTGFGQGMGSGDDSSDSSFARDEDKDDTEMLLRESDSIDPEAPTDEDMDGDEGPILSRPHTPRLARKTDYLADDLFAAAFASQNSRPDPKKSEETTQKQTVKKRRRTSSTHPKDLVIGGRTIRTLPRLSDPRSQATARTVPSARARKFVDQNLAMEGKNAFIKAKKKGWERRPANVGVMKYQGAPHGFVRGTR